MHPLTEHSVIAETYVDQYIRLAIRIAFIPLCRSWLGMILMVINLADFCKVLLMDRGVGLVLWGGYYYSGGADDAVADAVAGFDDGINRFLVG